VSGRYASSHAEGAEGQLWPIGPADSAGKDRMLVALTEMAELLASQDDPRLTPARLLKFAVEHLGFVDAGVLLTEDPEQGDLRIEASEGRDVSGLESAFMVASEISSGGSVERDETETTSQPEALLRCLANKLSGDGGAEEASSFPIEDGAEAVVMPLFLEGRMAGAMLLRPVSGRGLLAQEDATFLRVMAEILARSIESSRRVRERLVAQALEAERLKSELVSTLAHEMRTPLTSVKGYSTALLMDDLAFDHETVQGFLQLIDEECDILEDLIEDLLESSIIDAGLLRLEPQPVRLARLVQDTIAEKEARAGEYRFIADFPRGFPLVDADPNRITQVLRNLLDNAVKYSPQGSMVVVKGEEREDEVVISVSDQGVGIAPEHLNRLFDKFFRAESIAGRHVVGSGLGLPIARTIVESHGGRIWAESQLGHGSTFYFTLPLAGPSQNLED